MRNPLENADTQKNRIMNKKHITVPALLKKKEDGEKIVVLTAYDFPFAKLADEAGMDIILVGDTLGIVVQGQESTLPVTMDQMVYHTRMVARATKQALVVADMPFMSYQSGMEDTLKNAGRLMKEGGAAAVKFEGGVGITDRVEMLSRYDMPVMAHIGLTPQSVHRMGGYKVQGRSAGQARQLIDDAKQLESAGAFSIVLEGMPNALAKTISETLRIPTIGIGAGPHCDGQVLVMHDLLGLFTRFHPKFVRRYADFTAIAKEAFSRYGSDVRTGKFPNEAEGYE